MTDDTDLYPPSKPKKKPRVSGRGCKARGDNYERELAEYLSLAVGLPIARAPLSGGGAINVLAGGADLIGTPGLHIEAKRVERLNIPEAMRQAHAAIAKQKSEDRAVVISRKNRVATEDSTVVLSLKHFTEFYSAWLEVNGYVEIY